LEETRKNESVKRYEAINIGKNTVKKEKRKKRFQYTNQTKVLDSIGREEGACVLGGGEQTIVMCVCLSQERFYLSGTRAKGRVKGRSWVLGEGKKNVIAQE